MNRVWQSVLMMCALLLAAPAWSADDDYRMGTGDVARITVYGNPDLTTEARVGEDGGLTFPLIGAVKASGLTPSALSLSGLDAESDVTFGLIFLWERCTVRT